MGNDWIKFTYLKFPCLSVFIRGEMLFQYY
jgi:hypothetical protein